MNKKISNKELKDFGFIVGFGILILAGIAPMIFGHAFAYWTIIICSILVLLGILKPILLLYPYKFWMILGNSLGWLNSRIILGLIFIFILIPISFLMRIFGYDPLRKRKKDKNSYKESKNSDEINLTKIF